ncbi:MAG: hypothetical protein ACR2ML_06900 [Solirubrobacteraceae bacterium]
MASVAQERKLVVEVKRWPAYMLTAMIPLMTGLYGGLIVLLIVVRLPSGVWSALPFVAPLLFVAVLQLALAARVARQAVLVVRYPPRLSAEGMRAWSAALPAATSWCLGRG